MVRTFVMCVLAGWYAVKVLGSVRLRAVTSKDSECSDGPAVSRQSCLARSSKCMWLQLEAENRCMPCEWGGIDLPCLPIGSVFAGSAVRNCEMSCAHQKIITKVSACTDVSGGISKDECFTKGTSALTKCMWTSYKIEGGESKSMCGPCVVDGVGTIPPYVAGQNGPEVNSTIVDSASQCALSSSGGLPCDNALGISAITPCDPMGQPTPPPAAVPLSTFGIKTDPAAPEYFAVPVAFPYDEAHYQQASALAAQMAGWPQGEPMLPEASAKVFGPPPPQGPTLPPSLHAYLAPAVGIPGVPPPGMGYGTAPPSEETTPLPSAAASLLSLEAQHSISGSDAPAPPVMAPRKLLRWKSL